MKKEQRTIGLETDSVQFATKPMMVTAICQTDLYDPLIEALGAPKDPIPMSEVIEPRTACAGEEDDEDDDKDSQESMQNEPNDEEVYRLDLPPPQEASLSDEPYVYVDDWAESRLYHYVQ